MGQARRAGKENPILTLTFAQPPGLSPEAKSRLAVVVRSLRERLLKDLGDAVQSTYRLSLPLEDADLPEEAHHQRQRLEAWLDEQTRGGARGAKETAAQARQRHLQGAVKRAAGTLLNRLVVMRQIEALSLSRVKVLSGGWQSPGYKEFRAFAPELLGDDTEGYAELLRMAFEEWALDLPGLFGDVGPTGLVPVPPSTLRAAVEALEDPVLAPAWTDDTTLGWVYQFWNDPDREALDEKIRTGRDGGKIENHEIAAKTQLFTDRYMVEWLLQNSLGQLWFGLCARQGWTPEVVAQGTLERLEARRAEWRARRDAGEVDLEALMPLPGAERPDLYDLEQEERWKYWVPRELPSDAAPTAPASLREVKLLDPACGSGHFLVIAFDLLAALYQEEARHRQAAGEVLDEEAWAPEGIATCILEQNLHGIDLDPRAVQIAAAALWLKARVWCRQVGGARAVARPHSFARAEGPRLNRINLVASNLGLALLPPDDPALLELIEAVQLETGVPERLTRQIVEALKGADHLGSLLKVDAAVEAALTAWETQQRQANVGRGQGNLFGSAQQLDFEDQDLASRRRGLVDRLEQFLRRHTRADELGLRLRGQQLAAGVRFARMLREGQYDLVVGNPPYQGTSKMEGGEYLARHYAEGKADLYVAFMLRGLQLARVGGLSSLLTLRGWMFLGQFEKLRTTLLERYDLQVLGDLDRGGFETILDEVVAVAMSLVRNAPPSQRAALAQLPTPREDRSRDARRTERKRAALLAGVGRHTFHPARLQAVPGWPLVYWWDEEFLARYAATAKLGDRFPGRAVQSLGDNTRLTRMPWEIPPSEATFTAEESIDLRYAKWTPFLNGAAGTAWYEPARQVVKWWNRGLLIKLSKAYKTGGSSFKLANEEYYLRRGVAFSMIGASFTARLHRYRSVFGNMGSSVFPDDPAQAVCLMNSRQAQYVMEALNPGVHFEVGDVNRLPLFPIESADQIVARLDEAFTEHEAHRETSVEFRQPGPSCWAWAQDWAQAAVDRPAGAPLPPWKPVHTQGSPLDHLSFALGVAMGRFDAPSSGAEGHRTKQHAVLDEAPPTSLPHGILFLAATNTPADGLAHPAARPLHEAWAAHGAAIAPKATLHEYLRLKFFPDDHLKRYEKRPIYFPLSSQRKNFVAWVSIHRFSRHGMDDTLQVLLADHLHPELSRLAGELADLAEARQTGERQDQVRAQARAAEVQALHDELAAFANLVEEVASNGAPRTGKAPAREVDARFRMDLDDGVMVNSAALWPLLKPQWKDPEKWWAELCLGGLPPSGGAGGGSKRSDYDWSHVAARYFPTRVDAKCQQDPSLAVAHGCFWKYHPAKAYQWELRLQAPDELGPDFMLEEPGNTGEVFSGLSASEHWRADFEQAHRDQARELREAEERRRQRKAGGEADETGPAEGELDFEGEGEDEE